jgi:hypothetical protein
MPETDARGHTVPSATGDAPSRQGWVLDPLLTVRDPIPTANTTTRAALITALASESITPSSSEPIFVFRADAASGEELEYTIDGTNWLTVPATSVPWTTYTATITGSTTSPSVGGGQSRGRYMVTGNRVDGFFSHVFGSGSSAGSGNYLFNLPAAWNSSTLQANDVLGAAWLLNSGVTHAVGVLVCGTSTTTAYIHPHGESLSVGSTSPWVWSTSDQIRARFSYETA